MAAKKKRAAPRKPKKRAGCPIKKKKVSTKRPAADILDNTPPPFRPSQPSSMHWDNSSTLEAAVQIATWPQNRNAALLATSGTVEPPTPLRSPPDIPQPMTAVASGTVTLTASPLVTSSPAFGSPTLHAEMIEQIKALERELRKHQRRGIGHNKPPEPIEPGPLSAKELGEIRKAMAVLKKQPPAPTAPSAKAKAAVSLLTKFASATGVYVVKQADNFVTEAVKKSGEKIVQYAFWSAIINQLLNLADIAHRWLQSLGPHL